MNVSSRWSHRSGCTRQPFFVFSLLLKFFKNKRFVRATRPARRSHGPRSCHRILFIVHFYFPEESGITKTASKTWRLHNPWMVWHILFISRLRCVGFWNFSYTIKRVRETGRHSDAKMIVVLYRGDSIVFLINCSW